MQAYQLMESLGTGGFAAGESPYSYQVQARHLLFHNFFPLFNLLLLRLLMQSFVPAAKKMAL
jgi:hypothetical protein